MILSSDQEKVKKKSSRQIKRKSETQILIFMNSKPTLIRVERLPSVTHSLKSDRRFGIWLQSSEELSSGEQGIVWNQPGNGGEDDESEADIFSNG